MRLRSGERLPFCVGALKDRGSFSPDTQAGRPAVLMLGGALQSPDLLPVKTALARHAQAFAALDTDLLVVGGFSAGPDAWLPAAANAPDLPVILCNDSFFEECGLEPGADAVVVVDRGWRMLDCWLTSEHDAACLAEAALQTVMAIPRAASDLCRLPAPLLALPKLFDKDLCAKLIAHFESASNTFDSGVSGATTTGPARDRLDGDKKRRTDCLLMPGDEVFQPVLEALIRRCVPEIKRAFQMDITHNDRILIARYDETGGYFKRHRDNMNEAVAFRQFALSVNLNSHEYEGGELMFPEFNNNRYSPGVGEGVVFSTSLLHEVLAVTRGRRYVLLTFLHGAEAENCRLAYLRRKDEERQAGLALAS